MKVKPDENEDQVKLKPIIGIRPGVYLTVIYSIILLVIIFLLLVNPGLKSPAAALIVKTEPAGAAIRVNDIFMGSSGSKIIVPGGTHTITAVMPGFEDENAVHEIKGRVFGSRFFPRPYKIEFTLKTTDPAAAFALYAADFAAWSFGGEPTEAWQIPMSLSEGAYRTGRQAAEKNEELQQILLAASRYAVTKVALRDLIRAKALLDNYGNAPSPLTLIGSISDVLVFLSANPGSAAWLSRLIGGDTAFEIRNSEWAENEYDAQTDFFPDFEAAQLTSRINVIGMNFTGLRAGRLLNKGPASTHRPFGHNIYIESFLVAETPVSRTLFYTFLNENPRWREHHIEYYPDEIAFLPETSGTEFITGITWYAANAFCEWLTGRLPSSIAGMEVRLPTEDEWEYASLSIGNMRGLGWEREWCADPYAPLNFINAPYEAIQIVGSPEYSIRGREQRASLPPDFSSPFVTFRPVIAAKR